MPRIARRRANLTFRTTTEQRDQLERVAKIEDRKVSAVVRRLISNGLDRERVTAEHEKTKPGR
jgi:hypothetical protein